MRNLKRFFAVILTVAILASLMVPALASVSNLEEAKKLQSIGLFAGEEADLKLDEDVTRIQGLTFAIRAAGKEEEALAMTDEEVAAELAKFNDADEIPSWNGNGPKYVAYAIKNGITVGDGQGNFLPLAKISGRAFLVFLMKAGMGYADATTLNVVDLAVEKGLCTPAQAINYGLAEDGIIRDDAAAILFGAATNGVNADGKKFIEALIDSGFVSAEKAAEAGFITLAPEVLEAEVAAKNLKEVVVTFNKDVEDVDGIDKVENYKFKNLTTTKASVDGNVVILTLEDNADNQTSYKLTISKDILGEDAEYDVYFFDATMPEVVGLTVTGPKSFDLKFSEPIDDIGTLTLKSGTSTLSIDTSSLNAGKGSDTFNVKMYSTFADGKTYTLNVKNFADFAGYNNVVETLEFTYVKDTSTPEASITAASQERVVVEFSKPVSTITNENFAHTFNGWEALSVTTEDSYAATETLNDVSKVYVWFYDGDDDNNKARPIAEGTTTLYIKAETDAGKVKDNWGNEFKDTELSVTVSADKTAPEIVEIKPVDNEQTIYVRFDEAVKFEAKNIEVLDLDGKEIDGVTVKDPESGDEDYSYKVDLSKSLAGKSIVVTIKDVTDTSLYANKMADFSVTLEIGDLSAPEINDIYFTEEDGEEYLYVFYNEDVDDSALNVSNYFRVRGYMRLSGDAEFYINDKTVRIQLSKKDEITVGVDQILITGVKDLAGNEAEAIIFEEIKDLDDYRPTIDKAEATAPDKVEVTFDSELSVVDKDAFAVNNTTSSIAAMEYKLVDGKTVVILSLTDDDIVGFDNENDVTVSLADASLLKNLFDIAPAGDESKVIEDKVAPELVAEDAITHEGNRITIKFVEKLSTTGEQFIVNDLVITNADGDVLKAGIDYSTDVDDDSDTTTIVVTVDGVDSLVDYTIKSKDSITYIQDEKGNTAKAFTDKVTLEAAGN